jgi:low affinity Fe/Cu permease
MQNPHMNSKKSLSRKIEQLASGVIRLASSNMALLLCFGVVLIWSIDGFFAHFSQRWESIIGTISSVITVLMVFLIQRAQSKDSLAIQLKLNELVAAHELASNRLVDVEGMTEEELKILQKYYTKLSRFAKGQDTLTESHSIDEIHKEHAIRQELERELETVAQITESDKKDTN